MSRSTLALIFISVLLSSIAQIALKGGMSHPDVMSAAARGFNIAMLRSVATSPLVLGGLAVYFASTVVWLSVLSRTDVSLAYPFVGLGFVMTAIMAWAIHGEVLTPARIVGTLLICSGVVVLARS